jgi:hypothetical protein
MPTPPPPGPNICRTRSSLHAPTRIAFASLCVRECHGLVRRAERGGAPMHQHLGYRPGCSVFPLRSSAHGLRFIGWPPLTPEVIADVDVRKKRQALSQEASTPHTNVHTTRT